MPKRKKPKIIANTRHSICVVCKQHLHYCECPGATNTMLKRRKKENKTKHLNI